MLRALLAEDHPLEFFADIEFVSAVLEAPRYVDDGDHRAYVVFLEEMFSRRPEVFNLGADWFVRQMAYAYVREGRDRDIAHLLPPLLGDEYEPHEAVFDLEDLLGHKEPAGFNLYLLSLDFGRWLTEDRRMPPLVADTMRCFVFWCLVEMREKSDRNPLTLHQQRLDKYLARLLGFMSLLHLRGVATLIGMRHFHDFLLSVNLIDEGEHRRERRICDDLWSQMHRAVGDTAPDCTFLNKYL